MVGALSESLTRRGSRARGPDRRRYAAPGWPRSVPTQRRRGRPGGGRPTVTASRVEPAALGLRVGRLGLAGLRLGARIGAGLGLLALRGLGSSTVSGDDDRRDDEPGGDQKARW